MLFTTTFLSIIKATNTDNNAKITTLEGEVKKLEEKLTGLKAKKTEIEDLINLKNYLEKNTDIDELVKEGKRLNEDVDNAKTEQETVKNAYEDAAAQKTKETTQTALTAANKDLADAQTKAKEAAEALTKFKNEHGFSDDFKEIVSINDFANMIAFDAAKLKELINWMS